METNRLKNEKFYLYKHTTPNGKTYIGITSNSPHRRWMNGFGYKNTPYFYNAILKYGWDNITHEILYEDLSLEEAASKEIELIKYYKDLKLSYNLANGGTTNAGYTSSEKQREHARNIWKGKKIPREIIEKGAAKRVGLIHSEDTKKLMSISMRKAHAKPVLKVDFEGNILNRYESLDDASIKNNIDRKALHRCCNLNQLKVNGVIYLYEQEYKNFGISKRLDKKRRPVSVYLGDNLIERFDYYKDAAKAFGYSPETIQKACSNKFGNHKVGIYNFIYEYIPNTKNGTSTNQKLQEG